MKDKRIIFLVVMIIIAVFALMRVGNISKSNDNITYNKNRSFLKKKVVSGITFSNIECYYDGHDSFIKYVISNKTKEKIYLNKYDILVKDKDGVVISTITIDFSQYIEVGEKMTYRNQIVGVDLSKASIMEIKTDK